jgi:polyferredoxin
MANARNSLEWFRPMWRRVALLAFVAAWTAWEWLWNQNPNDVIWDYVTLGLVAYAVWMFFITFDRNVGPPPDGGDTPKPPAA